MRLLSTIFLSVSLLFSEVPVLDKNQKIKHKLESLRCPIINQSDYFVEVAERYDLDYRLLPSIAIMESSCGKHYIRNTNNFLGWGSGKIKFRDQKECIESVAKYISKNYPKGTKAILKKFNPRPEYAVGVESVMKSF